MPRRFTKSKRVAPLRPQPVQTVAPGVTFQRNGVIIDASICSAFQNWSASEDPIQEVEEASNAPHEERGETGDDVVM